MSAHQKNTVCNLRLGVTMKKNGPVSHTSSYSLSLCALSPLLSLCPELSAPLRIFEFCTQSIDDISFNS